MGPYQYSPLPEDRRHFRLLQIVHKGEDVNTVGAPELSVELKTFPLNEAPPYWAFSYTWGSPRCGPNGEEPDPALQASVTIKCNGAPIQIGENLHDFLCLSRDGGLFMSSVSVQDGSASSWVEPFTNLTPGSVDWRGARTAYLWIDALCINQESLEERSQQVRLMSAIYALAKHVLVWLGRQAPPPETAWAFKSFLPRLFDLARDKPEIMGQSTIDFEDGKAVDALGAEACARWRAAYPELFIFLARTRWFRRGWIVQEVILKDSLDVTMLCGTEAFCFEYFLGLMTILFLGLRSGSVLMLRIKLSRFDQEGPGLWAAPSSTLHTLDTLRKVSRLIYSNSTRTMTKWQRVLKLVANMGRSSFTDPRDRLFGCLGLIEAIVPKKDLDSVVPDYTRSRAEVMTTFARLLYENIYDLEYMFSLAGYDPASTSDLPSWVPELAFTTGRSAFNALGVRANFTGSFNASKLLPVPRCQVKVDSRALVLNGTRLDVAGELVASQKPRRVCAEWIIKYCEQDDIYVPTGQGRPEAVILTLSINNNNVQRRADQLNHPSASAGHVASTARNWYLQLLVIMLRNDLVPKDSMVALTAAAKRHPDWVPTSAEVTAAGESTMDDKPTVKTLMGNVWDNQISTFVHDRRLFLTDGGLLCLGPKPVRSGDEVWIVRGSRVPILLRRAEDGDGYHLIGETYVHGVMYGEAVTEEFERQFAPVKIV